LVPDVLAGARPEVTLIEPLSGLPIYLKVEPLGMIFGAVASFLWIVNSIYSIGYMRGHNEQNQTRFYVCFAIALGSTIGVAFAGNMFTLFIFYEVLTLSTYPLVTHKGDRKAVMGGRTYLGILLCTSIGLQMLAVIWTWTATGTLDFTPGGILAGKVEGPEVGILLFLYMYGIGKAALMPVHRWLPAAMVAPTPVSALLHAVAVVKAGVFSVVKVVVYIFGLDFLNTAENTSWLLYVAAATILIGSVIALRQDNLKRRLAYSTVSQLSYIVLGAMLATSWGIVGSGLHLAMHAFGKITLFFCAGAIMVASHKTEISQMRGIGRTMPLTTFGFLIGSLSIIGLPPFGGMWGKWFLLLGSFDAGQLAMVAVLILGTILNIMYLLPIPFHGFFSKPAGEHQVEGIREAPIPCLIAISVTSLGCFALFFFSDTAYELLLQIATP
ncbi:MAG: monovalent cation/H+ antiporter subunit D family protein, partial [Kiloniellales bacterium]|nr:monovalent cation/H+ antiporter subunit D family protein [Kiloniellales bacterium]